MRARGFVALCMGVALAAGACGEAGDDRTLDTMRDPAPATEPAPPSAAATPPDRGTEQTVSGTLGKVDTDARTFTLNANDREETFRYTDATDVAGAAGTQGLSGRQGDRVTVHYREEAGAMVATRITIEGGASSPAARPPQSPSSQPSSQQPGSS